MEANQQLSRRKVPGLGVGMDPKNKWQNATDRCGRTCTLYICGICVLKAEYVWLHAYMRASVRAHIFATFICICMHIAVQCAVSWGVRLVVIPLQKLYICVMICPNTYEANCPVVPSSSSWIFNLLQDVHLTSSNQLTISIFWITKYSTQKNTRYQRNSQPWEPTKNLIPSHQSLTWPGFRNRDALCRWCRDKDSNVYPSRVWGSHAWSDAGRAIPLKKKRKRWKPSHRAVFSEIVVYCSNLASNRTAARGADWPRQGLQFPASPGSTARMPRNECASAHLAHRTGIKSFHSGCGMYIYIYIYIDLHI